MAQAAFLHLTAGIDLQSLKPRNAHSFTTLLYDAALLKYLCFLKAEATRLLIHATVTWQCGISPSQGIIGMAEALTEHASLNSLLREWYSVF